MNLKIIQERFETYQCQTQTEIENALKEISQEIALAALSRSGFFKQAVFHGGTCLRILYSLNRFSEDLDFVLEQPDTTFSWDHFLKNVGEEFLAFGMKVDFQDRSKMDNVVKKVFLKDNSLGKLLKVKLRDPQQLIKIKFELDTNPPAGSQYDIKYLDFPYPFAVTTQDLPSLFAGKCHALLCREYTKGRDWYDFIWYTARKVKPNFELLQNSMIQNGPWKNKKIEVNSDWFIREMKKKIKSINWKEAKGDILRFVKTQELPSLDLWVEDFFLGQLEKITPFFQ